MCTLCSLEKPRAKPFRGAVHHAKPRFSHDKHNVCFDTRRQDSRRADGLMSINQITLREIEHDVYSRIKLQQTQLKYKMCLDTNPMYGSDSKRGHTAEAMWIEMKQRQCQLVNHANKSILIRHALCSKQAEGVHVYSLPLKETRTRFTQIDFTIHRQKDCESVQPATYAASHILTRHARYNSKSNPDQMRWRCVANELHKKRPTRDVFPLSAF